MSRLLAMIAALMMLPVSSHAFSYATGDCATGGCASGETFLDTNANEIDTALDALEARDTIAEHESLETINVVLETEMDASSELRALIDDESGTGAILFAGGAIGAATADTPAVDDNDTSVATTAFVQTELTDLLAGEAVVLDTDIGVTVQAYDADLADLADGSLSGALIGAPAGVGIDASVITSGRMSSTARLPTTVIEESELATTTMINDLTVDADFITNSYTGNLSITGNAAFTGTLQGAVSVTAVSGTTATLLSTTAIGGLYNCTNAAGCDITLPAAAAGLNFCARDSNGGGVVTIDAAAGDEIELDGVGVGVADAIDSAGAKGDFICLLALDGVTWASMGRSGTWVDGGAD